MVKAFSYCEIRYLSKSSSYQVEIRMPNLKKRQRRTAREDENQAMTKRLRSSAEAVEVVQLASDPKTDRNASSRSDGNIQSQAQVTPSLTEFIDFDKVMAESELIPQAGPSNSFPNTLPDPQQTSFPGGEETLRLGSDDISSHVPNQICQKIWAHEYINLNLLLKGNVELQDFCSGGVLHITDKGQVESRPKLVKEKITTIDQWTDAFLIFASIYLKKYPGKMQEILHYMSIIREAATRSFSLSWRTYDEQFRIRQASNVQSWAKLNSDLWLRVMTANTYALQSGPSHWPKAHCLDFNNGFCSFKPCKFTHACSHCGGSNHGRQSCFKLTSPNEQASTRGITNFRQYRGSPLPPRGRGRPFNRRGSRY